ncbi:AAA domain-containing protein [Phellopilus nigrolimitatus]|nr:AAA domain-containing protein [Phellopilus nigrolimitatus]
MHSSTSREEAQEKSLSDVAASLKLTDSSDISTVVQLTENFRLNPDLGEFVSTIYKRSFKPQKTQTVKIASQLESLSAIEGHDATFMRAKDILVALSAAMRRKPQALLREPATKSKDFQAIPNPVLDTRPISLALVRLEATSARPGQMGYETHVRGEATFAAALVRLLQQAAPEESVFVATPHRVQRQAVKDALLTRVDDLADAFGTLQLRDEEAPPFAKEKVTVDTIERLQGSEAGFVICLFSHTYAPNASTAIDFLLERRRLNVAISRAKTLCILVTSQEVLRPSVRVFANAQSAKGFAFLKAFEDRAWSTDCVRLAWTNSQTINDIRQVPTYMYVHVFVQFSILHEKPKLLYQCPLSTYKIRKEYFIHTCLIEVSPRMPVRLWLINTGLQSVKQIKSM